MLSFKMLLALAIFLLFSFSAAFVPPKPGSDLEKTYEPVQAYRARLGIVYNYTPQLLHPEACRYISEDECRTADQNLQKHARNHQRIVQEQHHRRQLKLLEQQQQQETTAAQTRQPRQSHGTVHDVHRANQHLRAPSSEHLSQQELLEVNQAVEGIFSRTYGVGATPPTKEEELAELEDLLAYYNTTFESEQRQQQRRQLQDTHNPSVGTFRVLILLMQFTDHKDRKLPDKYEYQILWNLRIKKWLDENSHGKYNAFFDVQDWMMTDNTEAYYSFGESGRTPKFQDAFYPLLNALEQQPGWSWGPYDVDNDGYLDNLIVLHSGYAAEEGGTDCTNGRTQENRIWSHAFADAGQWKSADGSKSVLGYMISSALDLTCNNEPAKMGVMTHEYLHTFYLIDLYDTSFEGKGTGNFDIMSYPYGHMDDGYIPVSLSAWSRTELEWQTCTEITSSGEYTLGPSTQTTDCYRITLLDITDFDEYLLVENRQQNGFDVNHFSNGIAMYHIDDWAADQAFRGMPGQEGWPENGNHYRVAVVQADGNYDLENSNNIGDAGDVWKPGMKLTPNDDGNTFPNTDSYQEGYIENTGVTVEILEQNGMNMKFKVTFSDRSDSTLFGAPVKEGQERPAFSTRRPSVPPEPALDMGSSEADKDKPVGGKIPQLPWYDEWKENQLQLQQEESSSSGLPDDQEEQKGDAVIVTEEQSSQEAQDRDPMSEDTDIGDADPLGSSESGAVRVGFWAFVIPAMAIPVLLLC